VEFVFTAEELASTEEDLSQRSEEGYGEAEGWGDGAERQSRE
jgi:hypothetical protein